jgi:hypothetical protein
MPITKEELITQTQFYINKDKTTLFSDNKPETQLRNGQLTPIESNTALENYGMKTLLQTIVQKQVTLKSPADVEQFPHFIESKQKVQRLLLSRYEVLDTYEHSPYKVGSIIESPLRLAEEIMLKNPHIFKKLQWWEDRTEEELYGVFFKWWDEDENEEVVSYRQPHSSIIPEPASRSEYRAYQNRQYDIILEEYINILLCI